MRELLARLNRYCLFLLVFAVTFESWDVFGFGGTQSIAYFAGILYIVSCIPLLKNNFSFSHQKKYLVPLFIFVVIGILSTAIHSIHAPDIIDIFKTRFFQLIILMAFVANQIYNDKKLLWSILNVYVACVFAMFILYTLDIGAGFEKGRLTIFGENPNSIGMKAVLAFLIVLSDLLESKFSKFKFIFKVLLLLSFINLIILSASRGALVSVFLGILVFVYFLKISPLKKIFLAIFSGIISIFLFSYVMQTSELFSRRLSATIESGDIGRNELWATGLQIIEDNLFIGVGLYAEVQMMYQYSGREMGIHNTFLWALMTTGLIGFSFFLLFIYRLGNNLFKTYKATRMVLFLVIYVIVLSNWAKSGGGINKMIFWFFFAILIGSTFLKQESSIKR